MATDYIKNLHLKFNNQIITIQPCICSYCAPMQFFLLDMDNNNKNKQKEHTCDYLYFCHLLEQYKKLDANVVIQFVITYYFESEWYSTVYGVTLKGDTENGQKFDFGEMLLDLIIRTFKIAGDIERLTEFKNYKENKTQLQNILGSMLGSTLEMEKPPSDDTVVSKKWIN